MATVRAELARVWPLFGLTIRTPRLELKLPTDRDIARLIKVSRRGVHAPSWVPMGDWTYQPSPKFEQSSFQHHCEKRASWKPEDWSLHLAVYLDGSPIGCQDIFAANFSICRSAKTGSWIGYRFQGNGYGTEMRQAVAHLAFEVLGAQAIWSGYWHDNEASKGVSRKLGYEVIYDRLEGRYQPDGSDEKPEIMYEIRLRPDHWNRPDYAITVEGFEPCRVMFGL
jgi:RimJ/RimL family protein N-acetyltransferase